MSKQVSTQSLAESHGLEFKDCGGGHVQIIGHGVLVNYWPNAKRRTAHCPETGRKETDCTPWDAVKLCLDGAKGGLRPSKKPSKNGPAFSPEPFTTNPAGLRHFYGGELPPWDESHGEYAPLTFSDQLRLDAIDYQQKADRIRGQAMMIDEEPT